MECARKLATFVYVILVPGLFACSEPTVTTPATGASAANRTAVATGPTTGSMLSGLEAYRENWRNALLSAARGDSSGVHALVALQDTISSLAQHRVKTSATFMPSKPSSPRGGLPSAMEEENYSESGNSEILASETWPNLTTTGTGSNLGSYVLFVGTDATTSAEYRVVSRQTNTGDWAPAGTNTSAPRRVNSLTDCLRQHNGTCWWTQQQDATFNIQGVPKCGVKLGGRGTHETSFAGTDLSVSGTVDGISIGLTFHVQNPAQHANQADAAEESPGADCKPPTPHFVMMDGADESATDGGTLSLTGAQGVTLDASPSSEGDYPISGYSWDDGSVFSTSETTSLYLEPGDYSVTMSANDDYGDEASASGDISIADTMDVYTGSGGGSGGDEDCWDVFLVYEDGSEQYWFSFCCDAGGHCAES